MTTILEHLRDRKGQPKWAANNQTLLRDESNLTVLTSLSPSAATLTRSFRGFAALAPKLKAALRVVPDVAPNETSVVLHLQVEKAVVLLGADLEVTASTDAGWHAIVASEERPTARASVYKVAHHGSQNADTVGIWESLLVERPASMLTPYTPSSLPRARDVERLAAVSSLLFQSAPGKVRPIRRGRAVERTIATTARKPPVPRRGKMGHIRLRLSSKTGAVISSETFGAALEVAVGRKSVSG
jgi:hypothetical protein